MNNINKYKMMIPKIVTEKIYLIFISRFVYIEYKFIWVLSM